MAKLLKHFGIGVKKSGSTGSSSSSSHRSGAEYNAQKSNSVQELLPKSPTCYRSSQSLSTATSSSNEYDTHSLLKLYSAQAAAGAVPATDTNHHQRLSCTVNGRHEGHRGHGGGSSRSKEQKSLSPKASNSNETHSSYSGIEGTLLEERDAFSSSPDPALAAEPSLQTATPPRLLDEYCDPLDLKKIVSDGAELLGAIAPTPALDDDYSVPYEVKKILKGARPKERYGGTGPSVYGQPVDGSMGRSTEVNGCIMEDSFDEPWEWTTKLSALVAQNPSVYTPAISLTPIMTPKKCPRGQQADGSALFNGYKASVGTGLISPGSSEDEQGNVSLCLEPKLGQKDVLNETRVTNRQMSLSPKRVSCHHSEKLNENSGKEQSACYAKSDIVTPDKIGSTDYLSGGLLIASDIPPIIDADPCDCRIVFAKIPDSERLPSCMAAESASVATLNQMNESDESSSKSGGNFQNFAKERRDKADLAATRSWNSVSESAGSSTQQKCGYNRQSQSHLGNSSYVKTLKLSSNKSGGCMSSKSEHPTASSHCITKERINPDIVLQKQCWYHGSIGRIEAEELLQPEKDGSFLVRISESSKLDYSLSLKSGCGFLHMKIVNSDGKFILGQFSQPFDSIPQMIEFYCVSKLPIKGSENISLIHPLANSCGL